MQKSIIDMAELLGRAPSARRIPAWLQRDTWTFEGIGMLAACSRSVQPNAFCALRNVCIVLLVVFHSIVFPIDWDWRVRCSRMRAIHCRPLAVATRWIQLWTTSLRPLSDHRIYFFDRPVADGTMRSRWRVQTRQVFKRRCVSPKWSWPLGRERLAKSLPFPLKQRQPVKRIASPRIMGQFSSLECRMIDTTRYQRFQSLLLFCFVSTIMTGKFLTGLLASRRRCPRSGAYRYSHSHRPCETDVGFSTLH